MSPPTSVEINTIVSLEFKKNSKDDSFWKILSAAIELDVKKGHLKWTLSDLSRKSGITRSLIYYYFGRSKVSILREAVNMIGEDLCGLSEERTQLWKEGRLLESMQQARLVYEKAPYIGTFMLEHLQQDNEIGESLRQTQNAFLQKIKTFFPSASSTEIKAVFTIYWGLNFAPDVDDGVIHIVIEMMKKALKL